MVSYGLSIYSAYLQYIGCLWWFFRNATSAVPLQYNGAATAGGG